MKIYETSVKKPISTILIFVGVIVFGLYSLNNLAVDQYPEMDIPVVSVMTSYPGANAADIETNVTRILEDNLNTVDNLDKITSKSSDNVSLVTLELKWGSDIDQAMNDVRDVVGRVQSLLPEESETPTIFKFSSSMIPVIVLYATADESYPALKKILDDKLVNTLNRIDGVGAVSLMGATEREIQINVDPRKLEAYKISVEAIGNVLTKENIDVPGGSIDVGNQTLSIRGKGEFTSSDEINNLVVATRGGKQIYLKDIAVVKDTLKELTLDERINGKLAARVIVQKQSGANTVNIAKDVIKALPDIQASLPPDIKIGVVVDLSEYIVNSIDSLSETVLFAFLFVMLVVFFFLGRWRATFIIILTIPVSLIVSFIYLNIADSTLNIISLSSLSIAIGLVVDDAIVVLENITKHIERGSSPKQAAIYATNEVWLAVIATTLVIVAVFMPLTMLTGMAGIMFKELGWIVSLVTVVSTIAAITLTPMLSSLMLKSKVNFKDKKAFFSYKPIERFLDRLDTWYAKVLTWSVRHRTLILSIAISIFVSSIFLMRLVPSEFFPKSDSGRIDATVKLDQGRSVEYSMKTARQIETLIKEKYPEVKIISSSTGVADGKNIYAALMGDSGTHVIKLILKLTSSEDRERSVFEIGDLLREDFKNIPEIKEFKVATGSSGPSGSTADIQVKVFGYDMNKAEKIAKEIQEKAKTIKGATDIQLSREDMRPEYRVIFDRTKLSYYGLSTAQVSTAIRNRVNGLLASKYREDGDEYDIYVRYAEEYRKSVANIENIIIYNPAGKAIRVKDVGNVIEEFAPPTIERENRERMIAVNITLSGAALSEVVSGIQDNLETMDIPDDLFVEIGGTYEDQQESFTDMITLMILIIILVYIVMATQFESFRMPFIILFSLPFAFTGVFLALYLTNTPLSVIALIGAIMLVGIVVKNGIVMVDFANLLRERGAGLSTSVINAGKSRLRPVLMTSLTTILGMLPMAIGSGEGSETWQPMGIAVIGGLTFSTILTLIVVPVVYTLFAARTLKKERCKKLNK
ncbi:MAG: efflux RND transporter permease subunit [Bacteroidetes bacterium]|nr:efflux RND transporter permease subunit [Bacteroidota bacterium]